MRNREVWHIMCRDVEVASFEVDYETSSVLNYQIYDNSKPIALPFPTDCNGSPIFDDFIAYIHMRIKAKVKETKGLVVTLDITVSDAIALIHRTHGIMPEDFEWVRFDDEQLTFTDVDFYART